MYIQTCTIAVNNLHIYVHILRYIYQLFPAVHFIIIILLSFFLISSLLAFKVTWTTWKQLPGAQLQVTKLQGDIGTKWCDQFKVAANGGLKKWWAAVPASIIFHLCLRSVLVWEGEVSRTFKTLQKHIIMGKSCQLTVQDSVPSGQTLLGESTLWKLNVCSCDKIFFWDGRRGAYPSNDHEHGPWD